MHAISHSTANSEGPVIYHALPEGSQNIRLWDMTEGQQALVALAPGFRFQGVDIRFESDELDERAVRFVRRINQIIALLDNHLVDFSLFHSDRPLLVSERPLNDVKPSMNSEMAGPVVC